MDLAYIATAPSGRVMQMPSVPETVNDSRKQFAGIIHIAISVGSVEKVDSLTSELSRDGYRVLEGPRKTGDGYYESVVLDLENNRVEISNVRLDPCMQDLLLSSNRRHQHGIRPTVQDFVIDFCFPQCPAVLPHRKNRYCRSQRRLF